MVNYRDEKPLYYKELSSSAILAYFEDERATAEEIGWIKNVLSSEEYKLHKNPISKWNWGKIKTAFAKEFFPDIAPAEKKEKSLSTEDRINKLLNM